MMLPKSAVEEIGNLDESQFMYGEDIDWCKRLLIKGWKIRYFPDIQLIHYGGESSKQVPLMTNLENERSSHHYFRKHHGAIYAWFFLLQVLLFSFLKYSWRKIGLGKKSTILIEKDKNLAAWALGRIIGLKSNEYRPKNI